MLVIKTKKGTELQLTWILLNLSALFPCNKLPALLGARDDVSDIIQVYSSNSEVSQATLPNPRPALQPCNQSPPFCSDQ